MKGERHYVVVRVHAVTGKLWYYVASQDSYMKRLLSLPDHPPQQVYGLGTKMSYAEAHVKKREMDGNRNARKATA